LEGNFPGRNGVKKSLPKLPTGSWITEVKSLRENALSWQIRFDSPERNPVKVILKQMKEDESRLSHSDETHRFQFVTM
jgi:hypothetical protein